MSELERAVASRLLASPVPLTADLIAAARRHRVHLVIAGGMSPGEARDLPELTRELRIAAAVDAASETHVRRTLDALAAGGVDALLLKGAALAYVLYQAPHLRPRVDTDLLIERGMLERLERVLAALGWQHTVGPEAELSAAQRHYVMPGAIDTLLHLDVHWRLANPRVFGDGPSFADLRSRAIDVPALGSAARTLSMPDALWLACLHRVAHHGDAVDLLWLWDIHLLIETLAPAERDRFVAVARGASMTVVCRRGVALAAEWFGTPGAAALDDALRLAGRSDEPSARFVGGLAPAAVLRADLSSIPGWPARLSLIAEHALPSVTYMRSIYPRWPVLLLPLAYAFRIVRGIPRWIRSPK